MNNLQSRNAKLINKSKQPRLAPPMFTNAHQYMPNILIGPFKGTKSNTDTQQALPAPAVTWGHHYFPHRLRFTTIN